MTKHTEQNWQSSSDSISLEQAHALLKRFDCLPQGSNVTQELTHAQIRDALLRVASQSEYQMLGICAGSLDEGKLALDSYTKALGYELHPTLDDIEGAVYIKFNSKAGRCFADSYTGKHRGVLVSCQSAYESGVNEMYGHLPLDLFLKA